MICPYCGNEMEKGRVMISAAGSIPVAFMEWYEEKSFESKKSFFSSVKFKTISVAYSDDGYYEQAYHCGDCHKIFGEFPASE